MAHSILLLNGSPRKNGNTSLLCDAFVRGVEMAGGIVARFDLRTMNIHGCLGCMKGGKNKQSPCVQKDDMEQIYPAYVACDTIVLASPLYYWSFSGQLKTAFDRLFAVAETDPNHANPRKDCALIMTAEDDTAENWKPVLDYYAALVDFLGWHDVGRVLASGFFTAGAVAGTPIIAGTQRFGAKLCGLILPR